MDKLPTELVTLVCSFLGPRDIGHLRRASTFYAIVGCPVMFRQVHLLFTPDSFERLRAVCSNPTLASFVTSLYYEADTLPFFESFEDWEFRLSDWELELVYPPNSNSSERARRAYRPGLDHLKKRPRHHHTQLELSAAYQEYLDYSKVQDAMREDNYHAGRIADAMAHLPNLKEIILSLEGWAGKRSKSLEDTYSDSYVKPYGDNSWTEPLGVPQMLSLLQGVGPTQINLRTLCGGLLDWSFFEQSDEVFQDLQKAIRNLQELKLEFSTGIQEAEDASDQVAIFGVELTDCAEYLKNGRLREFLGAAPNLRLLDLQFDWSNPNCPADLRYVVGKHKWEFLADVTLSNFDSRAKDLVGFCRIHATTLRRLVLDDIKLVKGSWPSTFQRMRRLLHLKQVRICGDLEAFEFDEYWSFTLMESRNETTMSQIVQAYLLQGGDGPLLDLSMYNEVAELELEELEGSLEKYGNLVLREPTVIHY